MSFMMIEFKYFRHGGLPDGLTLENIKQGMVAKRNKITVEILDKIDAIENYASGVRRIFKDYIGFDKQPEYSISDNGIIVTLYNMNYNEKENEAQNEVINDGINDGIKSKLSHIAVKKRERIEKLLEIINESPSVASDSIAIQLGISRPTAERYLAELRRMEIVKREGSNKNGKWLIL
mgnify:CR=1 FL=1